MISPMLLVLCATFFNIVATQVIDSDKQNHVVIGDPQVECLSDVVSFKFQTKLPYTGHIYVQGHHETKDCHKDYDLNRDNSGFMDIDFHKCGMRRQRTTNPKGMSMQAVMVVQFHRTFVTYRDRAYNIECFYLEEERVVSNNMSVSALTTEAMDIVPPMPQCLYQVLEGGPDGEPVAYAQIGQLVYHQWTCNYPMPEIYCMLIHSCTVDDGEQNLYEVIDKNGCSKDHQILNDVRYKGDLLAGTESQVFKFADKAHVYFTCQVRLSLKNEHASEICPRPDCKTKSLVRRLRLKRSAAPRRPKSDKDIGQDFDLLARPVLVLDLDDTAPTTYSDNRLRSSTQHHPLSPAGVLTWQQQSRPLPTSLRNLGGVCLSEASLGILIAAAIISFITAITMGCVYCAKSRAHKL